METPEGSPEKLKRKPPGMAKGPYSQGQGMSTDAIIRDKTGTNTPKTPGNGRGFLVESEATHAKCVYLINHEFRQLQLDKQIATMLVFDLIDHCAMLFEQLTAKTPQNGEDALKIYVRSFLIFNYFVNTFIMVHFNGFARFMETQPQDFIIYLNLYNFYHNDEIVAPDAFPVHPATVRKWTLDYLMEKRLLTFDVALLYTWLDDYIEYLKNKEKPSAEFHEMAEQFIDSYQSHDGIDGQDTYLDPENGVPDEYFDFNSRFPEVPIAVTNLAAKRGTDTKREIPTSRRVVHAPPAKTPYPVSEKLESPLPYPTEAVTPAISREILPQSRERTWNRAPVPIPPQAPPAPPHKTPSYALSYPLESSHQKPPSPQKIPAAYAQGHGMGQDYGLKKFPTDGSNPVLLLKYTGHTSVQALPRTNGAIPVNGSNGAIYGHGILRASTSNGVILNSPQSNIHHIPRHSHNQGYNQGQGQIRIKKPLVAICGLKNLGSSCYINLTIQLLVGLAPFETILLQRTKAANPQPLVEASAGLIGTFNANGGANIAPTKFLRVLSALKPDFNVPFEQQDAQEFLLFLLDRLHEEMAHRPREDAVDYLTKWNITVNPRDTEEYLRWYRELLKHDGESPINDTCQGHVQSKLVCSTCGHRSVSYSPFTILSLPIPASNAYNHSVDLTECLRYFTQDEVLTGENAWHCPKCNKSAAKENPMDVVFQPKRGLFRLKRSKSPAKKPLTQVPATTSISIKQLSFIKLPPVMFIHLSRFSMNNGTDKLNTDITYPLRLKFNHLSHDIYYSLCGLINHYGTLKSGHYTALVNKARTSATHPDPLADPTWCFFDDDSVRVNVHHGNVHSSEHNKLHSRDVYVLCYERV